jgi:hypothetical protein
MTELSKNTQVPQCDKTTVINRYLVEYLNKGGDCRQTYVEAINEEVAKKAFFVYNDGTITSVTYIRHL